MNEPQQLLGPLSQRILAGESLLPAMTPQKVRNALELAARIDTGQDCPAENHAIACAAMEALEAVAKRMLEDETPDILVHRSAVTGVHLIADERERQIILEGWTPEHDDKHAQGELARAGACYAMMTACQLEGMDSDTIHDLVLPRLRWPWDEDWWKPKDEIRNLIKAGALIAAQIDVLQRALAAHQAEVNEADRQSSLRGCRPLEALSDCCESPALGEIIDKHGMCSSCRDHAHFPRAGYCETCDDDPCQCPDGEEVDRG